jgi:hypothetical protein
MGAEWRERSPLTSLTFVIAGLIPESLLGREFFSGYSYHKNSSKYQLNLLRHKKQLIALLIYLLNKQANIHTNKGIELLIRYPWSQIRWERIRYDRVGRSTRRAEYTKDVNMIAT